MVSQNILLGLKDEGLVREMREVAMFLISRLQYYLGKINGGMED